MTDFRAEKKAQNPVTSLAVMVFSVLIFGPLRRLSDSLGDDFHGSFCLGSYV